MLIQLKTRKMVSLLPVDKQSCHAHVVVPFVGSSPLGGASGCADDCTNCTMKQSAILTGQVFDSGGYLNLQAEPRIIMIGEEYPASFNEMNAVPQVSAKN